MIKGDGTKIVKTMQNIANSSRQDDAGVITGKVISLSPLLIQVGKIKLPAELLVLSALVKRTVIKIPALDIDLYRDDNMHHHEVEELTTSIALTDTLAHSHVVPAHVTSDKLPEICLWRGLEVGDTVYMLKLDRGQMYYVMQREEGIE